MTEKLLENVIQALSEAVGNTEEVKKKQITIQINEPLLRTIDFLIGKIEELGANLPRNRNQFFQDSANEYAKVLINGLEKTGQITDEELIREINRNQSWEVVVVPGAEEPFQSLFLKERRWYPINIDKRKVNDVKYIAYYRTKSFQGISHYAKVKSFEPIDRNPQKDVLKYMEAEGKSLDGNYYQFYIEDPIELENPIVRGDATAPRNRRFTTLEKLLSAKNIRQL